jgi:hypothetical protein
MKSASSPGANFSKVVTIQQGATYYYDLDDESSSNLVDGWFGSAVITAGSGKKIMVVTNTFLGSHGLHSANAFAASDLDSAWVIPLFSSRLANGLNTSVAVQNLSGSTMQAGDIDLTCTKRPGTTGPDTLAASNTASVPNNEAMSFNPVVDTVNFPDNWIGGCRVSTTGNVAVRVVVRFPGVVDNTAAFEGIRASGTDTRVVVPLAAKRLPNGFATSIFIHNLSTTITATVDLNYIPSPDYVASGGSPNTITVTGLTIGPDTSLNRNLRITSGPEAETALPDGWYGSLTVQSTNSMPLGSMVQLTNMFGTSGDTLRSHGVFTLP